MRIGTIFTGGTIGSRVGGDGYIATEKGAPFLLLETYNHKHDHEIEFITSKPYEILSENLNAFYLNRLIQKVGEMLKDTSLDGIIVTHGTDTLQYSAAVLAYVYGWAKIPIVLVSSNYVLTDERGNGFANFEYGVRFVGERRGTGVFVSYCNKKGVPTFHRGTRLQPPVPLADDVFSVKDTWYGRYVDGMYEENPHYYFCEENINSLDVLSPNSKLKFQECSSGVLRIVPYVGMEYPKLHRGIKAVLHESFHSGTIGISKELLDFMEEARGMHIPVFLAGLSGTETAYETVKNYEKIGIFVLPESAGIAQYCKLWLGADSGLDIYQVMNNSVAEDWILGQ